MSLTRRRNAQLIHQLQDGDLITFVSVRDPLERIKSAYNWRKHACQKHRCAYEERFMYEFCYTTLNAFSEGACDGSFCGGGWNATSAQSYVALFNKALERQWLDCRGDCRAVAREMWRDAPPARSCGDVRRAIVDRAIGTSRRTDRRGRLRFGAGAGAGARVAFRWLTLPFAHGNAP